MLLRYKQIQCCENCAGIRSCVLAETSSVRKTWLSQCPRQALAKGRKHRSIERRTLDENKVHKVAIEFSSQGSELFTDRRPCRFYMEHSSLASHCFAGTGLYDYPFAAKTGSRRHGACEGYVHTRESQQLGKFRALLSRCRANARQPVGCSHDDHPLQNLLGKDLLV